MKIKKITDTEFKSEKSRKRTQRKRNPISRYYKSSMVSYGKSSNYQYRETPDLNFVRAPNKFSIQLHTQKTLRFFDDMGSIIRAGKSIFLDMSKITYLSEDALLYLISRLDYLAEKYPNHIVQGNIPNDSVCKNLFMKSKFLKYANTQIDYDEKDEDIFPIHDGAKAEGGIVSEVISFVKNYIKLDGFAERFYGPMMECIINTSNHAYSKQNIGSKWWMIAIPESAKKIVHFTTLDNGFGIPHTVRKNYLERLQNRFGKHILVSSTIDADLINSALLGELRTKTGKGYRGTGLPSIFELIYIPKIRNLRVISNHGHIWYSEDGMNCNKFRMKNKFHGTCISWDFVQ